MSLHHVLGKVSKDDFKNDLIALIDFDEDINGNNGIEYTRDEAVEKGYESTIEWAVTESVNELGMTEEAIKSAVDEAVGNDGHYENIEVVVYEYSDHFVVSVACVLNI